MLAQVIERFASANPNILFKNLGINLNPEEIRRVRAHYAHLGRDPTDIELQTIAQTWSEHCYHKVFKSKIKFGKREIDGLFKSYIKKATQELSPKWIVSAFEDNAGIIEFEGPSWIAAKVETHNHPSAVDPFGGAATGVGGVIRDILGVWADPIANTDILCFSDPKSSTRLPKGGKSSQYLMKGVISGIGSYGNNMGIPTVNGAIWFDGSFAGYTLVFCGCVGLLKNKKYLATAKAGDALVIAGSRTGREGIHGVNFASDVLSTESSEMRSAVQIPNPIEEEKLKRSISQIASKHLASAVNDLGGGGLSSAVCEIAKRYGCGSEVDLASVPVSSNDIAPWEIWISETQERMLVIVPQKTLSKVLSIFEHEEVEATAIGTLTPGSEIKLAYRSEKLGALPMDFLFSPPLPTLKASERKREITKPSAKQLAVLKNLKKAQDFSQDLLDLLSSSNIASKNAIVRTYDHEVQGNTILRPFQHPNAGPNDAAVIKPLQDSRQGLVISCAVNPGFGKIDPYWMAASVIDEAIRNNVAAGGRRIALLDNFAWGNPEDPAQLGSLVRAAEACYTFATSYGTPFISGKDSLYNETGLGPIAPTLTISSLGIVPDISNCVSASFKKGNSSIFLVGATLPEMGGSEYFHLKGLDGLGEIPKVEPGLATLMYKAINRITDQNIALACHDLSSGGLAVALAEMCFGNQFGCKIELPKALSSSKEPTAYESLFSESNSRLLLEIPEGKEKKFEEIMEGLPFERLGTVGGLDLVINYPGENLIDVSVRDCYDSWNSTFET